MQQLEDEFECMQQAASSSAIDSLVMKLQSTSHITPTHTAAIEFLLMSPPHKCLNQHLHAIVYVLNSKQLLLLTECEYSSDLNEHEHYADAHDDVEPLENTPGLQDDCDAAVHAVKQQIIETEVATDEIHKDNHDMLDADADFLLELEKFGLGTET